MKRIAGTSDRESLKFLSPPPRPTLCFCTPGRSYLLEAGIRGDNIFGNKENSLRTKVYKGEHVEHKV